MFSLSNANVGRFHRLFVLKDDEMQDIVTLLGSSGGEMASLLARVTALEGGKLSIDDIASLASMGASLGLNGLGTWPTSSITNLEPRLASLESGTGMSALQFTRHRLEETASGD